MSTWCKIDLESLARGESLPPAVFRAIMSDLSAVEELERLMPADAHPPLEPLDTDVTLVEAALYAQDQLNDPARREAAAALFEQLAGTEAPPIRAAVATAHGPPYERGGNRTYVTVDLETRRAVDQAVLRQFKTEGSCVPSKMLRDFGVVVTYEQVYEIVHRAFREGEFGLAPNARPHLAHHIQQRGGLHSVQIAGLNYESFTRGGASALHDIVLDLGSKCARPVRIGVAGGHTPINVIQLALERLAGNTRLKKPQLFPMLPDAFFKYTPLSAFVGDKAEFLNPWGNTRHLPETGFAGLAIPSMIPKDRFTELLQLDRGFSEAILSWDQLDIVVTSGTVWDDEHGGMNVKHHYRRQTPPVAGIVGELLWHLIGDAGPIEDIDRMPVTCLGSKGLGRLADMVDQGVRVLALLGPCLTCGHLKTRLVECLLRQKRQYVTDLALDIRTAEALCPDAPSAAKELRRDVPGSDPGLPNAS